MTESIHKRLDHMHISFFVWLCVGICSQGCSQSVTSEIESLQAQKLVNTHFRVVWAQDVGDSTDVFARGVNLRLMGYDSHDGKGERVLLSGPGNFSKPMLSEDGEHIVYTNLKDGFVYILGWDKKKPVPLIKGKGLEVWRDENGVDWVYVGTEPARSRSPSYHRITRYQLYSRKMHETVWHGQPVGEDSFQLSGDGALAGGTFPWPDCGVLHVEHQYIQKVGRGCWPSMAPDHSNRFWIFDGSHKYIRLYHALGQEPTHISLAEPSELHGYELYHPRWSNHPRYMIMTGPYKNRSGGNNIRGGGTDVEIYICLFHENFRSIEQWGKLTENQHADFYPDLWISPPESARSE